MIVLLLYIRGVSEEQNSHFGKIFEEIVNN